MIVDQAEKGSPQQEILRSSESARLRARLESLLVIEQAKSILMAQHGWGPDEALLCCGGRRSNSTLLSRS